MRIFITFILFCLPLRLMSAPGDVLWLTVGTNGWDAYLAVQGLNTNGTYNLSPTTNNRLRLTVTSMAFDDSGNGTTTQREILGTYRVRKPVPNEGIADEQIIDSTNVVLRIALSDLIYSRDSNITVSVKSALYVAGGVTNNAASGITVTNLSTLNYPATIANWSWPGWQRISNSTHTLRAVAFHKFAEQGRPVRAVEFSATDGTTSMTNIVTRPTVDWSMGDALPFAEYIGRLTVPAAWTNGAIVTNHFRAIPWVGDNIRSTYDGVHSEPGVFWRPQRSFNDVSNRLGITIAVVATNGSSSGVASTNALDTGSPPAAFANVNQAAAAIAATNNIIYGRNSVDGAIIYVQEGEHLWTGGSASTGNPIQTWVEITRWPLHAAENVVFTNHSGSRSINGLLKISEVRIDSESAQHITQATNVWLDRVIIDNTGAALVYAGTHWSLTRCVVSNFTQGFTPFSTQTSPLVLARGNRCEVSVTVRGYTVLGNRFVGATTFNDFYAGATIPPSTNLIIFNNQLARGGGVTTHFNIQSTTNYNGFAIIQNEAEYTNTTSVTIFSNFADGQTNVANNFLWWANTWTGQRANFNYNDTGGGSVERIGWSVIGNLGDDANIKTDTFATTNDTRIGNWATVFGNGMRANHFAQVTGVGATGFWAEYPGLYSVEGDGFSTDYVRFVNRRSYNGSTVGQGFGDYRVKSDSPLFRVLTPWVLSHDIEGVPRSQIDPPGVKVSGNPKKGAFF